MKAIRPQSLAAVDKTPQVEVIWKCLQDHSATSEELESLTGWKHQSVSARLHELEKAKCVRRGKKVDNAFNFEVIPGATLEDFYKWRSQESSQKTAKKRQSRVNDTLLKACRSTAKILKSGNPEAQATAMASLRELLLNM